MGGKGGNKGGKQTNDKGAFGVAVLYRKKRSNELVVIKEINTRGFTSADQHMALNEVKILFSLHHPNIIAYGRCFLHHDNLMIEMEYADRGTLWQMIKARQKYLSEKDILNLLYQISRAIVYIHASNILHRDLKTENVFLNSKGCIKVGDFGISKTLTTNKNAQTIIGTPCYYSPEMCRGRNYDKKSDIWAMGCMLYEMCCLHRIFEASSLPSLLHKIKKGDFKPIPSGYSTGLQNLVRELLAQNPKDRPSANEVKLNRIPQLLSLGANGSTPMIVQYSQLSSLKVVPVYVYQNNM